MNAPITPRPLDLAELFDKQECLEKYTRLADGINPQADPKDLRFMVALQWAAIIFITLGVLFIIILAPTTEGFAGIANVIALGVTVSGLGFAFSSMAHSTAQSIADAKQAKASEVQIAKAIIVVSQQVSAMHDALEQKQNNVCHNNVAGDYVGPGSHSPTGHLCRFIMKVKHLITGPK